MVVTKLYIDRGLIKIQASETPLISNQAINKLITCTLPYTLEKLSGIGYMIKTIGKL